MGRVAAVQQKVDAVKGVMVRAGDVVCVFADSARCDGVCVDVHAMCMGRRLWVLKTAG
jgi:hypothetical protein